MKELAACQAFSAVANFLRPFIPDCFSVSMNHHTGQAGELHVSYSPKRKEWLYWDKFYLVYSRCHVYQLVIYIVVQATVKNLCSTTNFSTSSSKSGPIFTPDLAAPGIWALVTDQHPIRPYSVRPSKIELNQDRLDVTRKPWRWEVRQGDGRRWEAMGGESKVIRGELSADHMKIDRSAKESRRIMLNHWIALLQYHKDATKDWYWEPCRDWLRADALSRKWDLDRYLGAMVVSSTTSRGSNVKMAQELREYCNGPRIQLVSKGGMWDSK